MNPRPFTSKPSAVNCLLLLMLTAAVFLPPRSSATRQSSLPPGIALSEKRKRPEFVPGQAFVRFKPNRAVEGQVLLNSSKETAAKVVSDLASQPSEQIPITVDRFEGSDLVEGLRMARMAPDKTLKAFRDNTGTIPAELHATHVAGTIGAVGNNGVGVAGVNWQTSLMSLRFISATTNSGTEAARDSKNRDSVV